MLNNSNYAIVTNNMNYPLGTMLNNSTNCR